jgi:hypothetical protein
VALCRSRIFAVKDLGTKSQIESLNLRTDVHLRRGGWCSGSNGRVPATPSSNLSTTKKKEGERHNKDTG